ncbi:MAG: radical SAM protein [Candidatus Pacearchaeota archaeon]
MKVFLINPDYLLYPFPPLGLAYIAGYIKKYIPKADIKILDQIPKERIIERILNEKPDVIGFSSTSPHHWKVKKLAVEIKKFYSKGIFVLGGIHVTNCPTTIENSPFDIGVLGEGEITFKKLLENIEKNNGINFNELKKISGFAFEYKGRFYNTGNGERIENLDDTPIPPRELLNMDYYSFPSFSNKYTFEPTGLMFTSRGCPYSCSFCSSVKFWGRCVKFFSAERVTEEIEILYKKYHYKIIQIYDDLFSMNKPRLRQIIELLKRKKILGKIKFKVFGRGNCFDEEIALLLKELNVVEVSFGIETGSERMLKYLKDSITLQDDIKAIELCREYGIQPLGAFMIGMPYETEEDLKDTYEFIKKYIHDRFVIAQMSPLPNTPVWDYAIKNNLIKKDIFEEEDRRFLDFDENYSLSLDTPKEVLRSYWFKILSLGPSDVFGWRKVLEIFEPSNQFGIKKMFTLRWRHITYLSHPVFLQKIYNLGIKREKQG